MKNLTLKKYHFDLFLSYCHQDQKVVLKLAENFHKKGMNMFLDTWESKLGDIIVREIESALADSNAGLIFISDDSIKSKWVKTEY
ncbi:MAG: toll/interleukin-1 receptor domain-containing protein [Candidatus Hodarchaeota archaeon]